MAFHFRSAEPNGLLVILIPPFGMANPSAQLRPATAPRAFLAYSNPCMPNFHCATTMAPFVGCRSPNVRMRVVGNQSAKMRPVGRRKVSLDIENCGHDDVADHRNHNGGRRV